MVVNDNIVQIWRNKPISPFSAHVLSKVGLCQSMCIVSRKKCSQMRYLFAMYRGKKKVADLNTFVYRSNRTSRVLLSWSCALQDRNMLEVASTDVNIMQLGFFPH